MTIYDRVKATRFFNLGRWTAIPAILAMIICPIFSLTSVLVFCVLTWIASAFVICFEFPIFSLCCRAGSKAENFILAAQRPAIRTGFYLLVDIMLWASIGEKLTLLIIPALLLTFSTLFYGLAAFKGEEPIVVKGSMAEVASPPVEIGKV